MCNEKDKANETEHDSSVWADAFSGPFSVSVYERAFGEKYRNARW